MNIVCIGGGIVGVFAALRARQLRPGASIVLVEQDDALGGLLRSDRHPNGLDFDRGTHVLSETGVREIDALLFDGLDAAHWRVFEGAERDLCGLLLGDEVREGSPFLPAQSTMVRDRLAAHLAPSDETVANLDALLAARFGRQIADGVFREPIRNLYRRELECLDPFVAGQLPLSRVVADEMAAWLSGAEDGSYRTLVACPDQRQLPRQYASPLKAMYPRRMGIGQLFDKLSRQLAQANVEVHLSTALSGVRVRGGRVEGLNFLAADGAGWSIEGEIELIWAVPPFPLPRLLGLPLRPAEVTSGWKTVIADFCVPVQRRLGCYYYIDYDDNDAFRLTNYSALSDEAATCEASPFTLELWWRNEAPPTPEAAEKVIVERFRRLGIIGQSEIPGIRLRFPSQGLVLATTGNIAALAEFGEAVRQASPSNLTGIGLLSEPRLFFTGDMLRSAERRLCERLD